MSAATGKITGNSAAGNITGNAGLQAKYRGKLNLDSVLIAIMLCLLYGAQLFLVYSVLTATKPVLAEFPGLTPIYLLFIGLMFTIETIGCLKVRHSIKQHMHEFRYYD
ncbi:monomethylamine permease [Methanosarcina sp. Mfa9]|uniref:monomethylamine permease n=1 Tax=Methanosarcina sp. Mfa9 TaxID=3439063 RepID=UPI003F82E926